MLFYLVGFIFFVFHFLSIFMFFFLSDGMSMVLYFGGLDFYGYVFNFLMYFDFISLVFFGVVMLISFVVFFYVGFYMGEMITFVRFYYLVFLFVLSMVFLVFSPSLFSVVLGWDGLGISSFLLICFYSDLMSLFSSVVVFLSNRFGDGILLLSFYWFMSSGDLYFYYFCDFYFFFIFLYFLIFFTSSAQFPFMIWLPVAMAAPTPVSSLVHSSTLVTAGVYLVIRFYFFLSDLVAFSFVRFISLFTFILAGILALVEFDLKKVIAFSTLSQLSMMIYICSSGVYMFSFLLLIYHALYKSLLFLIFGYSMSINIGVQDERMMVFSFLDFPLVVMILVLSGCSLFGMPFLAGFYVKDLFFSFLVYSDFFFFEFFIFFLGCIFTFLYSLKIFKFLYFYWYSGFSYMMMNLNYLVLFSLMYLSFYSIFFGGFFVDFMYFDFFVVVFFIDKIIPLMVLFFAVFLNFSIMRWSLVGLNFWGSFFYLYYFSYEFWYKFLGIFYHFVWSDGMWLENLVYKNIWGYRYKISSDFMFFLNFYVGISLLMFLFLGFGSFFLYMF